MTDQFMRIPVEELQTGMYVKDVFNERGVLLFTAGTLISNPRQIERLRKQGINSVIIDKHRGVENGTASASGTGEKVHSKSSDSVNEQAVIELKQELKTAQNIHSQTVDTICEMMTSVRAGRMFSIQSIRSTTENIVEKIIQNPDIYIGLCQLRIHDDRTYVHMVNVAVLTTAFSHALGYKDDAIMEIGIGALLHDIGKMRIPVELLKKGGKYTRLEYEVMKKHPLLGLEVIETVSAMPATVRNIIVQHHERLSGSGYPYGLKMDNIGESSMVCALADVYDALTTDNPYRPACLPQEALALIFQGSDHEYPRRLVEHFTKLLGIYPVGSFVKLESDEMGIVIKINRTSLLTPTVLILFDENSQYLKQPFVRDLAKAGREVDSIHSKIETSLDPSFYHVDVSNYFSGNAF